MSDLHDLINILEFHVSVALALGSVDPEDNGFEEALNYIISDFTALYEKADELEVFIPLVHESFPNGKTFVTQIELDELIKRGMIVQTPDGDWTLTEGTTIVPEGEPNDGEV